MCTRMKAAWISLFCKMHLVSNFVQKVFRLEIDLSQQFLFRKD
jgi:hypothetical protein